MGYENLEEELNHYVSETVWTGSVKQAHDRNKNDKLCCSAVINHPRANEKQVKFAKELLGKIFDKKNISGKEWAILFYYRKKLNEVEDTRWTL